MNKQNDNLPFKLYHGTSSIFLKSILTKGLGAVNPIQKLNAIAFSKKVYELGVKYQSEDELLQAGLMSLKWISNQTVHERANFQHGETYVSTSIERAMRHAVNSQYGGELLSHTQRVFSLLRVRASKNEIQAIAEEFEEIFDLMNFNPSPILITIESTERSNLLAENGQDANDVIGAYIKLLTSNKELVDLGVGAQAFRIANSVDASKLKVYLVVHSRYGYFSSMYDLYEINQEIADTVKMDD